MPKLIYHDSDGIDKVLLLGADQVLIGRAVECQVQTQDAMVSRRHARIYWDGNYWIEDLGSSNGVYVGNDKVQKAPFRPGDTVTCGSLVLRLVPDTSVRLTGTMTPMRGTTPPVGSPSMGAPPPPAPPLPAALSPTPAPPPLAPPPMAAPMAPPMAAPMAPPPMAQTLQPPRGGEVAIGPNAVLRGAMAPPNATTGMQNSIAEELRSERQRREQAEGALLQAEERVTRAESRAEKAEGRVKDAESRATELETLSKDASLLKRKLDQAQADIRRLRGGQPLEERSDDGESTALRARVAQLEAELKTERAAAATAATPAPAALPSAPGAVANDAELTKLKRQVEQLTSELRRARGGQPAEAPPPVVAPPPAAAKPDPAMADAAIALGDSLAELRSSLRAANDEAGLLTAPSESVQVVGDALRSAAEQLENARGHLRIMGKMLGVS
jgi:hypothetical protein